MADDVLKLLVSVNTKGEPKIKTLNKDLKNLDSQSKKTDKSVRGMGTGFSSLISPVASVTAGVTALYTAFSSLKTFAGFDDTMRQVGAVSNATAGELQQLTDLAKDMGAETRFSASEAAEGLKFLGMAGLDVQQQMTALPGVLNLASAGALDLGAAADIATNILTGYGLEVQDLGMVNDVLAKTFTSSNTSLQELGYAFTYAGSVAKSSGQGFTETAAALGMLANAGFKGEMGGTALRGALLKLQAPTKSGAAALARLGIAVNDSTGNMRPYLDIIDDLGKAQLTAADRADIFGVRAGSGVAALILQGSDAITKMRDTVNDYGGTTDRIATQMEAGIGGQLRALNSAFEALKISTGEAIAGALLDDVQNLTNYLRDNKDELRGFAVTLANAVATLVKGGIAIADFVVKNKGLVEAILTVTAGYKAYKIALLAGNAATLLMTGSTVALATVMRATLAGAFLYTSVQVFKAVGAYKEMRKAQDEAADAAMRGATGMTNYKTKLASATIASGHSVSSLQEMVDAIQAGEIAWDEAGQSFVKGSGEQQGAVGKNKDAVDGWVEKLETLQDSHNKTYDTIKAVTGVALEKLKSDWQSYADKVVSINQEIEDRSKSLSDRLREMGRSGMDAGAAWEDIAAQAKEAETQARALSEAGKLDEALKAADEAARLYAQLKGEVKEGETVLVSSEEALKSAMEGVKTAGELGIEILEQQKQLAKEAADELNRQSGFQLGDMYTEAGDKAKELNELQEAHNSLVQNTATDWGVVWESMQDGADNAFDAVGAEIQKTEAELETLTRDREVKITIKEVAGASGGTSVGVSGASGGASVGRLGRYPVRNGKNGRSLYGFGGGDTLRNLFALENGEQVINKHSVRKFGGWEMAQAYNDGDEMRVADALFKQFPHLSINIPSVPLVSQGISVQRETVYRTTVIDQISGVEFERQYNSSEGQRLDIEREKRIKASAERFKI